MGKHRRTAPAALGLALAMLVAANAAATSPAGGSAGPPQGHAARVVKATDSARLHYISASGSVLFEEGRATGALPGAMKVHMRVEAQFSGSFTIYARGGTISGHGRATPHGNGVYESFAGSLVASGGTGRFKHARGRARLYGTFNRRTYALVVQTVGTLYY